MDSIMELLVKKNHPEYTEDEIWAEVWQFCEDNELKIGLFLKRYSFASVSEAFDRLRIQVMSVICDSGDWEIQRMLRDITNFETGMLLLLADEKTRERLSDNLTKRLNCIIGGEAYTIAKKLPLSEKEFEAVLNKVMRLFFSEDMLEYKRERWEYAHPFHMKTNLSRERKVRMLREQIPMCYAVGWSKPYEPLQAKVNEYLIHDFHVDKRRDIANLMHDGFYDEGLQRAYDFSEAGKGRISVVFSGLCFGEQEELVFLSYVVRFDGMKKTIYRFKHDLSTFPEMNGVIMDADSLKEVEEEEFMRFCRSLYGRQYDI